MGDRERFEGFKREQIAENERKYGAEIREKYGEEAVEKSNAKRLSLSEEECGQMKEESRRLLSLLAEAARRKESPDSAAGMEIARLYREWLSHTWSAYSPEAHAGLVEMYVADERFTA